MFSEQVTSIRYSEDDGGPATVESSGSLSTAQYVLVVACDGLTSRTRAIGLGGNVREHMHPLYSWAAFFTIKKDLIDESKLVIFYSAPGGHLIGTGLNPSGGNIIGFMALHRHPDEQSIHSFREASKQGIDATKKFVYEHYKGSGWGTDEILAEMMATGEFYSTEFAQVKPPTL
ncbi:hypothetical protein N7468_001562 [Penicillium chermesinum]|uniref:FAD-binding domain-containing protein n=1 Tax=Penicillium chermesinum TaxID=63820 RepID=A0A9W9TYR8_9EURO|nr:uncharacterized protein N7468_001562 [Penicillium chermesinum]KAJ5246579.1 hypothetical protein N7468_001562 [Penicillium chermesinum]KAJ6144849.1 hypothetical protein N7470_008744 [Penicillium chermesinum]